MTVADVSTTDEDAVGAELEGFEDEVRRHPAGTHDSDHPDVGWILDPAHTGQVGAGVSAPIAAEGNDFGFELRTHD
jgi:hypothetical protein